MVVPTDAPPIAYLFQHRGERKVDIHDDSEMFLHHIPLALTEELARRRVLDRFPNATFVDGAKFYDCVRERTGQDPSELPRRFLR